MKNHLKTTANEIVKNKKSKLTSSKAKIANSPRNIVKRNHASTSELQRIKS